MVADLSESTTTNGDGWVVAIVAQVAFTCGRYDHSGAEPLFRE